MTKAGNFNPRPPRGGRPSCQYQKSGKKNISIHAPREGGDAIVCMMVLDISTFQSTPPARGATLGKFTENKNAGISIHAPREGGDKLIFVFGKKGSGISIHAPREGGDAVVLRSGPVCFPFQSTPPARGATFFRLSCPLEQVYFNPRPPRGGRRYSAFAVLCRLFISIHAPREGGDLPIFPASVKPFPISIHAPREGGDVIQLLRSCVDYLFQSTPPARGAT